MIAMESEAENSEVPKSCRQLIGNLVFFLFSFFSLFDNLIYVPQDEIFTTRYPATGELPVHPVRKQK